MRKPIIAGNWKMNKTPAQAAELIEALKPLVKDAQAEVVVCPTFVCLPAAAQALKGSNIHLGAQNVHFEKSGAFTGEVTVEMLKEIGVEYVIIGHSERRQYFGETDETVNLKLKKLLTGSIRPIMCVGESLEERDAGKAFDRVKSQLELGLADIAAADAAKIVIAYEPIWAIGTGRTATPEQAEEMCAFIRSTLIELYDEETADQVIIQYGGSVKPANATEIMNMDEIDGALVGGASLKAKDFMEIIDF